ncbi:MAG: NADH-quinone oxidoreductase subunit J [Bacteroidota bacterium]
MNVTIGQYLCEAIALTGAVAVLFSRSVFHSVLFFLTSTLAVAGLFAISGATYLGISQIALYGGGISVLMLFAVMISQEKADGRRPVPGLVNLIPPVALLVFLTIRIHPLQLERPEGPEMTAETTGAALAGSHLIPFEFAGVLLVVALVSSVMIAIQKKDPA